MVTQPFTSPLESSRSAPLCRDYAVIGHGSLTVQGENFGDTAHWLYGTLLDGQSEVLGMWLASAANLTPWDGLCADLLERGVERVRILLGTAPCTAWVDAYPSCLKISASSVRTTELKPNLRRLVRTTENALIRIHRDLRGADTRPVREAKQGATWSRLTDTLSGIEQRMRLQGTRDPHTRNRTS